MAERLPVAVIGAGPVGLAAAAHLVEAGEEPLVFEAGVAAGASVSQWGHVRLFSPWRMNIDAAGARLLERRGWTAPPGADHPTGAELVERYLLPLAGVPEIAGGLATATTVRHVTRAGHDRMKTAAREEAPFLLRLDGPAGERDVLARAVIDASGTWSRPNPLGVAGIPALGEEAARRRVRYGIPDVLGADRRRYAGRRVLVAGSGHSAFNALLDLAALAGDAPGTNVVWAIRRHSLGEVFGGGERDQLEERGRLGLLVRRLVDQGLVQLHTGTSIDRLEVSPTGVVVHSGGTFLAEVDEIIAATGFRPDLAMLGELRLAIDPALESPAVLAPLIDPNVHSCGTVPPHGVDELTHPEPGVYIVGMKSYGRAPTALMMTGYEQARSVVAALTGDWEAARQVRLRLPETGVCSTGPGPTPAAAGGLGEDPMVGATACCG